MDQFRPRVRGLVPVGLVVSFNLLIGLFAGRDAVILGSTVMVVIMTVSAGLGFTARRSSRQPPGKHVPVLDSIADGLTPSARTVTVDPARLPRSDLIPSGVLSRSRGRLFLQAAWGSRIAMVVSAICIAWFYFAGLGNNPAGLFCDEAEIGIRSREFLSWKLLTGRNLFFYHHFGYSQTGSLPLFATAPFTLMLGLSDFSVRLASAVWAAVAVVFLVALVRSIGWRYGEIGVIAYAGSPVYIHFARINFGHVISFCCVAAGIYCYARGEDARGLRWPVASGLLIAASLYGYGAYYLAAPVILGSLFLGVIAATGRRWRSYRNIIVAGVSAAICWLPVGVRWLTDPQFTKRLHQKTGSDDPVLSIQRLHAVLEKYDRYFSFDYLFRKGETGLPGGYILRHSVVGVGELSWILLPMVLLGLIVVFRFRDRRSRMFGVMSVAILVFYPIPDALSTPKDNPPYTFTAVATMLFIPMLSAAGVSWSCRWLATREIGAVVRPRLFATVVWAVVLVTGLRFFVGPYADYPKVSANYWGWQFGPRQAVEAFKRHRNDYQRYEMDGDFNEAFVFLDFYMYGDLELRRKTILGGLFGADITRHEMMAVRAEKYNALMESSDRLRDYVKIIEIIYYPDGTIAMYVLDVGYANRTNRVSMPY